jgi:DNA-binding NtrC family response regulator
MSRPRILVVDDHAATRTALNRLFSLKGWEVRCASGVAEAIGELSNPPDCLIVDMRLPDGDGEAVLEAIRSRGITTCAIVVSGDSDPERVNAIQERYHPAAVLLKPVRLDAMLKACSASAVAPAHAFVPPLATSPR